MKLWGAGTARSIRPIWVAEELGLAYELAPIGPRTGETQSSEFTSLNRKQKIPFLVDGEVRLSESVAICRYLTSTYPSLNIWTPKSVLQKAKEDEWICYIYGELDETSLYVMRRHGELAVIYGASDTAMKSAATYLKKHLGVVSHHLEGNDYLLGGDFSLADIMLVSCLDWAVYYGVGLSDALTAYRGRIAGRPAYRKAMRTNYKDLPGVEKLIGG